MSPTDIATTDAAVLDRPSAAQARHASWRRLAPWAVTGLRAAIVVALAACVLLQTQLPLVAREAAIWAPEVDPYAMAYAIAGVVALLAVEVGLVGAWLLESRLRAGESPVRPIEVIAGSAVVAFLASLGVAGHVAFVAVAAGPAALLAAVLAAVVSLGVLCACLGALARR